MAELSIIIPTQDRKNVLLETLSRLERQRCSAAFEVIVVNDGSTDGTSHAVLAAAEHSALTLRLLEIERSGPSAARNRGLTDANGHVCLFLGDDTWPRPDLVARHAVFHRKNPHREAALLGHVVWAPECSSSPLMDWLHSGGIQFAFHEIVDCGRVSGTFFYTANVSAKTSFLRDAGGFDESLFKLEDIELGLRLQAGGMRLVYDRAAVVEHYHPTDLTATLRRMREVGAAGAVLARRAPDRPIPREPALRHRVKAALLTALNLPGFRIRALRHETWRFLCHEAHREAFWGEPRPRHLVRIGAMLFRLAARDPATSVVWPASNRRHAGIRPRSASKRDDRIRS